jgi:adenine-specific DNA methylase
MASKKELLSQDIAKAVGAGKPVTLETVDFNDPDRPKTCLEVDFPLVTINEVASLEAASGASKKPIYQMSKWWARRQSSVFRSMLIAAATKAPDDSAHAAKAVWENYYANHQKKGSFRGLKITDIFMGGGTTLVEAARLGMQTSGNDLNPVAWFIVKQELSRVSMENVEALLADIDDYVRPQITPFFYCDGPAGEKGTWTHVSSNKKLPSSFDPLKLSIDERYDYRYEGPESVFTFWAKHGPCQVTGCGHRTPILSSSVIAIKSLTTKYWVHTCGKCHENYDIDEDNLRLSPGSPLFVSPSEPPYSLLDRKRGAVCPHCSHSEMPKLGKGKNKKVELTVLVHPDWLHGTANEDSSGSPMGGAAQDDAISTARWNTERSTNMRLLEIRGALPDVVTCPETKIAFRPAAGTVPKRSNYACGACGTVQDVLKTVKASGKAGPVAAYAFQGYSADAQENGASNGGRFFAAFGPHQANQYNAAVYEWEKRKDADLADYWPRSAIPYGFMTSIANSDLSVNHGLTHWWTFFNPRQLLVNSLLLKAICEVGGEKYDLETREFVLGAFQQFVRCNTNLSIWHLRNNQISAALSNSNFHPKSTSLEPSIFSTVGDGNWKSAIRGLPDALEWSNDPWELVSNINIARVKPEIEHLLSGKSEKIKTGDPVVSGVEISCGSSTDLSGVDTGSQDLVITDPPFGGLLHYSELSDFFYVWLRLALKGDYPKYFGPEFTPKSLEAVANRAREPEDADGFYKRLLTECWREAYRILKPGGILAFTFHHSEDEPWVAVLESLFDAGFYLEATYPIRSDETKGDGEYGSKTIEYDIIHVCRKRTDEPTSVSWGRMRREVMADVRQLQGLLENHAKEGLPAADIQVIRRGKALEYFSRHYGRVYVDEGRSISVKEALVGINQLIDEDADKGKEPPPVNAEPITRQFLRTFGTASEMKRDQLQKFLKGSITTPDEFEQRGWCLEKSKVITRVDPLSFAQDWSGRHKRRLTSDLDQALVLIGSCFDGSGINASDTLKNENFKPHIALKPLLEWLQRNGPDTKNRNAASVALTIYNSWAATQAVKPQQGSLFEEYEV